MFLSLPVVDRGSSTIDVVFYPSEIADRSADGRQVTTIVLQVYSTTTIATLKRIISVLKKVPLAELEVRQVSGNVFTAGILPDDSLILRRGEPYCVHHVVCSLTLEDCSSSGSDLKQFCVSDGLINARQPQMSTTPPTPSDRDARLIQESKCKRQKIDDGLVTGYAPVDEGVEAASDSTSSCGEAMMIAKDDPSTTQAPGGTAIVIDDTNARRPTKVDDAVYATNVGGKEGFFADVSQSSPSSAGQQECAGIDGEANLDTRDVIVKPVSVPIYLYSHASKTSVTSSGDYSNRCREDHVGIPMVLPLLLESTTAADLYRLVGEKLKYHEIWKSTADRHQSTCSQKAPEINSCEDASSLVLQPKLSSSGVAAANVTIGVTSNGFSATSRPEGETRLQKLRATTLSSTSAMEEASGGDGSKDAKGASLNRGLSSHSSSMAASFVKPIAPTAAVVGAVDSYVDALADQKAPPFTLTLTSGLSKSRELATTTASASVYIECRDILWRDARVITWPSQTEPVVLLKLHSDEEGVFDLSKATPRSDASPVAVNMSSSEEQVSSAAMETPQALDSRRRGTVA